MAGSYSVIPRPLRKPVLSNPFVIFHQASEINGTPSTPISFVATFTHMVSNNDTTAPSIEDPLNYGVTNPVSQ